MRLLGRGDEAADVETFEALVARHHTRFYRAAYRMTGNEQEAEDLLQEALLEAFRDFHRFRPGTRFDHWVLRIMTHTYIDGRRKRRVQAVWSLDSPPEEVQTEYLLADGASDPQRLLDRAQLEEPVQNALDSLSSEHRTILVLADIEGMSYEEIARVLRIPVGTVRSRLHRARERMRQMLAPVLRPAGMGITP